MEMNHYSARHQNVSAADKAMWVFLFHAKLWENADSTEW